MITGPIEGSGSAHSGHAWVTLVSNPEYIPGAVALLRSLRHFRTDADIVVLYTAGVPTDSLEPLSMFRPRLFFCPELPTSAPFKSAHSRETVHINAPFLKGVKPSFHTPLDNFAKLRLWQLGDYKKTVFVDADTLVLRNSDDLFDYPEFRAAPNVYECLADFRRMNSGVFTAVPSEETFRRMITHLDQPGKFWRRTDQTFLQEFFPNWNGLTVYDNMLQYVWINMPELWDWSLIRIVHYQYEKPWQKGHGKSDQLRPLIDLWDAFHTGEEIPEDISQLPLPV